MEYKSKTATQVAVFSVCSLSPRERASGRMSRQSLLTLNIKHIRTQMVVVNFL